MPFVRVTSELGRSVLADLGYPEGEVVVWMPATGGTSLIDPTDAEILEAGHPHHLETLIPISICWSSVPVPRASARPFMPRRKESVLSS